MRKAIYILIIIALLIAACQPTPSSGQMGVKSIGVTSELQRYRKSTVLYWDVRELLATAAALWDIHIAHPVPVLGNQEPIFP